MRDTLSTKQMAQAVLEELGIQETDVPAGRPASGHHSSMLLPCQGKDGRGAPLKNLLCKVYKVHGKDGIHE